MVTTGAMPFSLPRNRATRPETEDVKRDVQGGKRKGIFYLFFWWFPHTTDFSCIAKALLVQEVYE